MAINKPATIKTVKTYFGIEDEKQDAIIGIQFDQAEGRVLSYINGNTNYYNGIPRAIEWVVTSLMIKMYGRHGDEGKSSAKDGDFTSAYETNMLSEFASDLEKYRTQAARYDTSGSGAGFRFF